MPGPTINLLLALDPASEPIGGTIQLQPAGEITHFDGWLELAQAVEAARRCAGGAAASVTQIADPS